MDLGDTLQKETEKSNLKELEQFSNMIQLEENNMTKVAQIPKEDDGIQDRNELAILGYGNPKGNNLSKI
ncbi:44582_t:CDS:2, partial [Gigaspora margarita]